MEKSRTVGAARREFRVLVATDGSIQARHALAMVLRCPWPEGTRVRAVAARRTGAEFRRSILLAALDRSADIAGRGARRALKRRWPDAEAVVVDKAPVRAVLEESDKFGADVIALGWRGHGAVRRLLMGSVSRGVARAARCAVLIVRAQPADVARILIGFDGSAHAKRAVALLGSLPPPRGGEVTPFQAVDQMAIPAQGLAPADVHGTVKVEVRRINKERIEAARRALDHAAAELTRRGWRTRVVITTGAPLRDLLASAASARAHLVVVGARGVTGLRHLLLGSVAEGVLNRCPVAVLVVR